MATLLSLVIVLVSLLQVSYAQVSQATVTSLFKTFTKDTTALYHGHYPSTLVPLGTAVPVVVNNVDNTVVIAASSYGKGRVVVASSVYFFGSNQNFLLNAAAWATQNTPGKLGVAYLLPSYDYSADTLAFRNPSRYSSIKGITPGTTIPASTKLILCDTDVPLTGPQITALLNFVKKGGALLVAGQVWYWTYDKPGVDVFAAHPVNKLVVNFGILISSVISDPTSPSVAITADKPPKYLSNAVSAAKALVDENLKLASLEWSNHNAALASLKGALQAPLYLRGMAKLSQQLDRVPPAKYPPMALNTRVYPSDMGAFLVFYDMAKGQSLPVAAMKASPYAKAFPGLDAALKPAQLTNKLQVLATYPGYNKNYIYAGAGTPVMRSTGLFLAAGSRVTVTLPSTAIKAGLRVLVGCHTDDNTDIENWQRVPKITRSFPITAVNTSVGSAHGGLLYITVPPGAKLGNITVTISGPLVRAPWFKLGQTSKADWQATIRAHPGPWAELESSKIIFTVPSSFIRKVDDPAALMQWWAKAMDFHGAVVGLPGTWGRPERFVFDADISAGYMHSGYPVMAYLDPYSEQNTVKLSSLKVEGSWGVFHELGHNMQWDDWVLPGTTETSCNIFSVFTMEKLVGKTRAAGYGHPALLPTERAKTVAAYKAGGKNFDRDWSVWTALETILQLRERFGWGPFAKMFREYRTLTAAQRPTSDGEKVQQWVWRSSKALGRNLVPFYEAWGFPIWQQTRDSVAAMKLPVWSDHPMR